MSRVTMTAIDGDGLAAGVVDVSGVSGKVLRTVASAFWSQIDSHDRGLCT
ncbi:MAG: hypothetical protein R3F19_32405 [Verrucomicrobiales bacterium]